MLSYSYKITYVYVFNISKMVQRYITLLSESFTIRIGIHGADFSQNCSFKTALIPRLHVCFIMHSRRMPELPSFKITAYQLFKAHKSNCSRRAITSSTTHSMTMTPLPQMYHQRSYQWARLVSNKRHVFVIPFTRYWVNCKSTVWLFFVSGTRSSICRLRFPKHIPRKTRLEQLINVRAGSPFSMQLIRTAHRWRATANAYKWSRTTPSCSPKVNRYREPWVNFCSNYMGWTRRSIVLK